MYDNPREPRLPCPPADAHICGVVLKCTAPRQWGPSRKSGNLLLAKTLIFKEKLKENFK